MTSPPQLPPGVAADRRGATTAEDLRRINDLPVRVTAVVGRAEIDIAALLQLEPGSVVELDRKLGEPVDILVNDRIVARGEIVMIDDRLGVTMTEIVDPDQ